MRLALLFFTATFVALSLQTGALHWLPLGALVPDLVMVLAVDLGLRHHSVPAALIAFAIGYAADAFSGSLVGTNAFMATFIFLLCYWVSRHLLVSNNLVGAAMVFVAVMLRAIGLLVVSGGWGTAGGGQGAFVQAALIQAFLSAALSPIVFAFLARGRELLGLPGRVARE